MTTYFKTYEKSLRAKRLSARISFATAHRKKFPT